jgi:hypothetical protein
MEEKPVKLDAVMVVMCMKSAGKEGKRRTT